MKYLAALFLAAFLGIAAYIGAGGYYLAGLGWASPYESFSSFIAARVAARSGAKAKLQGQFVGDSPAVLYAHKALADARMWEGFQYPPGSPPVVFFTAFSWALQGGALTFLLSAAAFLTLVGIRDARAPDSARRKLARNTSPTVFSRRARRAQLTLAGVPLPEGSEYEPHVLMAGKTSMGKSVAIDSLIAQAREAGHSALVIDYNCEMIVRHFQRGDLIFNPFYRRGVPYSILADCQGELHRRSIAHAFFPVAEDSIHEYFNSAGRIITSQAIKKSRTNLDLWRMLGDRQVMAEAVQKTIAASYFDPSNKSTGEYVNSLVTALECLGYFPASAGVDPNTASIRKFIRQARVKPGRFLWVIVPNATRSALHHILPVIGSIAISEILSLGNAPAGWRFYVFLDELSQIPPVGGLHDALTAGRKPGLFLVAGVQHIAQLNKYGSSEAKAILSNFGARLVLRQGDAESAEYWSHQIGATEIKEWHRSTSNNPGGAGSSQSEHVRIRPRVLPHQIQELRKLRGYLLVTHHPAAAVGLQTVDRKLALREDFVLRDPSVDPPTAAEAFESEISGEGPAASGSSSPVGNQGSDDPPSAGGGGTGTASERAVELNPDEILKGEDAAGEDDDEKDEDKDGGREK